MGLSYFTKEGLIGIPLRKWHKTINVFQETFMSGEEGTLRLRNKVAAGKLQRAMGLFHHIVLVWSAGRPSLWPLWKCFYSATFKFKSVNRPNHALGKTKKTYRILRSKQEVLVLTNCAKKALKIWWSRLKDKEPPYRRILKCQQTTKISWINIIRRTVNQKHLLCVAIPSAIWELPEVHGDSNLVNAKQSREGSWLQVLSEGLAAMDVPSGTIAVVVRTNIRKLDLMIRKDLYVRGNVARSLAQGIHEQLWNMGQLANTSPTKELTSTKRYPLELRSSLLM